MMTVRCGQNSQNLSTENIPLKWNSAFFCVFIDYRGHHRKGVAIFNADYVNFQPKPWFQWKNMYFWTLQRGPKNKK